MRLSSINSINSSQPARSTRWNMCRLKFTGLSGKLTVADAILSPKQTHATG